MTFNVFDYSQENKDVLNGPSIYRAMYKKTVYYKRVLNCEVLNRIQSDSDVIIKAMEWTGKTDPGKPIICPFNTNYSALVGGSPQNPSEMWVTFS